MDYTVLRAVWLEIQGTGVDTIALRGGLWSVRKDMTQVATAVGTLNFGAAHPQGVIFGQLNVLVIFDVVKAGPAAA